MTFGVVSNGAFAHLDASTDRDVLTSMAQRLLSAGIVADTFAGAILAREEKFPTGLPTAVAAALPHTDPEHVIQEGVAVATLSEPVAFRQMGDSSSTVEVQFVVMMLLREAHSQLEALQQLVARLQDANGVRALLNCATDADLEAAAQEWLAG